MSSVFLFDFTQVKNDFYWVAHAHHSESQNFDFLSCNLEFLFHDFHFLSNNLDLFIL